MHRYTFREGRAWAVIDAGDMANAVLVEVDKGKATCLFSSEELAKTFVEEGQVVTFLDGPEKIVVFLEDQRQRGVGFVLPDPDRAEMPFAVATRIEMIIDEFRKP